MTPQRAVRPRASDPRVLDRPHLDGTAELVCRACARHVDGVFQGGGLEDHAAGHEILRFGVGAVGDHALVAPDRGPRVVERGSGVAPTLPGQLIGPAIPLLDVGLKFRRRQIVPRYSAPAKDQHELAPQGAFPASRVRHHGSQPYPPLVKSDGQPSSVTRLPFPVRCSILAMRCLGLARARAEPPAGASGSALVYRPVVARHGRVRDRLSGAGVQRPSVACAGTTAGRRPVAVSYCLAKNTSGSARPFGYRKLVTVSRLSPQAKYWWEPSLTLAM